MQGSYSGSGYTRRGSMNGGGGARSSFGTGTGRSSGSGRKLNALCSSCNAPLSQDEMLMSSATEGRCVACQQLAEAQSACRVCHLPWSNNQMNVVACDACGFYMHENCVKKGALQTKSGSRVYTYCPHCPPTLPAAGGGAGRDTGGGSGSLKGSEGRGGRQQAQRESSQSLSMAMSLPVSQQQALTGGPPSGRGGGGGGVGAVSNSLAAAAAAAAAALALPVQPQAAIQQVAALLQGQLRMLQTQQQALLRQYEQQLRTVTPGPPPSAYSLFQLDMFRVYQEEGFEIDPLELQPIIHNAWHQLTPDERAGYESRAQQESAGWTADAQLYVQLYYEYETLASHMGVPVDTGMLPKALQGMLAAARQVAAQAQQQQAQTQIRPASGAGSGRGPGRPPGSGAAGGGRGGGGVSAAAGASALLGAAAAAASGGGGGGGRGVKRPAIDALVGASALLGMGMSNRGGGGGGGGGGGVTAAEEDDDDDEDYEEGTSKRARRAISPAMAGVPPSRPPPRNTRLPADKLPTGIADLPAQLNVSCNDVAGVFVMDGIKVICNCKDCVDAPKSQREFHPTHWEQHCGAGTAKKWKASIKIEPGGAPEVPAGGNPMQIGKWFDMLGVEFRPAKTTGGPPVLEFTGATIRRLEAEGIVGGGLGAPTSSQLLMAQYNQIPPPQQQPQQQPAPLPQPQSQLLATAAAASAPPRPPRSLQPSPLNTARNNSLPSAPATAAAIGGGGGGGASASRRPDDAPPAPAPATTTGGIGPTSKPAPRPVSEGEGDGEGDADAAGYCPTAPARASDAHRSAVGSASGRDGGVGYDGDSSSRGSASDTPGPNTTATA